MVPVSVSTSKTRLESVRLLHPSVKFGKVSIFLASSGSFTMKNDKIHSLFRCFG